VKQEKTMGAQRREQLDLDLAAFENVITIYLDCVTLPHLAACSYEEGARKRTLSGIPLDYKIDVEIANRRILTTPEMQREWEHLVEERYKATNQPSKEELALERALKATASVEQRELTSRVIRACSKEYQRRQLHKVGSYFTRVRLKAGA
jgi:hypothetical protein